jgi:alpha-beta hydrolase superfamily lysophospholipase
MAKMVKLIFQCGGNTLEGWLHSPAYSPSYCAVISHGFGGFGDSPKWNYIAGGLARSGIPALRFSHRGCSGSEGDFADTTLTRRIEVLNAAMDYMTDEFGFRTFGLLGSSMGGATALACASQDRVCATFTLAAPINFDFFSTMITDCNYDSGNLLVDGREVKPALVEDAERWNIAEAASSAKNLFVMHGEADPLIPLSHAAEIYKLAPEPKKLMYVPGADHPFTEERHQRAVLEECIAWFQRFLKICPAERAEAEDVPDE